MDLITGIFESAGGASKYAIGIIALLAVLLILSILNMNVIQIIHSVGNKIVTTLGKVIGKKESKYHRDIEIGKINEKRVKVKLYRFLDELITDLGLRNSGITPYELMFMVVTMTLVATLILCKILFNSVAMTILIGPVIVIGVFCLMYTKANLAHDARIEDVITAENIICNNIKAGVLVAVRESLHSIPKSVRPDFERFIENIEHKNYHIKTALLDLNIRLGSVANDFIKKCIVFEMEEVHGISGMFQDIVELNIIKMKNRTRMKRRFEDERTRFIIGASMIFTFLLGTVIAFSNVRKFYLENPIGQLIIALDLLILILEFVYITYLRAKEL